MKKVFILLLFCFLPVANWGSSNMQELWDACCRLGGCMQDDMACSVMFMDNGRQHAITCARGTDAPPNSNAQALASAALERMGQGAAILGRYCTNGGRIDCSANNQSVSASLGCVLRSGINQDDARREIGEWCRQGPGAAAQSQNEIRCASFSLDSTDVRRQLCENNMARQAFDNWEDSNRRRTSMLSPNMAAMAGSEPAIEPIERGGTWQGSSCQCDEGHTRIIRNTTITTGPAANFGRIIGVESCVNCRANNDGDMWIRFPECRR